MLSVNGLVPEGESELARKIPRGFRALLGDHGMAEDFHAASGPGSSDEARA